MSDPKISWRTKETIDAERAAETQRQNEINAARERIKSSSANGLNAQQLGQRVADIEVILGLRDAST